ncbi:MAG: hypothetical protein PHU75_00910 [Candidatus Nanopelagicales bacterium]|nr:hypothetical protein [Candidatus Nanopelagicales bacterium]
MTRVRPRARVASGQEKVVIARSGNRCAYPDCRAELVFDADAEGDQPKVVGKVAHIAAASPGGPRYDASMTDAQRSSAENLIYLCGPHHDAVDSQLDKHTVKYLHDAKVTHESAVARAVKNALGNVTFEELGVICGAISSAPDPSQATTVELALPIQDKITLNELGAVSAERISAGLSQASRVAEFIAFQQQTSSNFGRRLVSSFKAEYFAAEAEGLDADGIFDSLVLTAYDNSGPRQTPTVEAAALAVVAYLFEICEIFRRE